MAPAAAGERNASISAPGANALGERLAGVPASRVSFKGICASVESGLIPGRARVARQTAERIVGRAIEAERGKRRTIAPGEVSTRSSWFRVGPGGHGDRCSDCTGCGACFGAGRAPNGRQLRVGIDGKRDRSDRPLGELSSGREVPPEPPENWLNLNRRPRDISSQLSDDFRRCLIKSIVKTVRIRLRQQRVGAAAS